MSDKKDLETPGIVLGDFCRLTLLADSMRPLIKEAHAIAKEKGFWDYDPPAANHAIPEKLMLIVSELSEALEALRRGNETSEKIPNFSEFEEELADAVIRIFDLAGAIDAAVPGFSMFDLAGAVAAKLFYNMGREYKHGKRF